MEIKATIAISDELMAILDECAEDVKREANEIIDAVAKETASRLKSTSPSDSGEYAKGWAVKRERGNRGINTVTVHNKNKPQLTHLLEHGHLIRNGSGTYGRTEPITHIKPAEEWANAEVMARIKRSI